MPPDHRGHKLSRGTRSQPAKPSEYTPDHHRKPSQGSTVTPFDEALRADLLALLLAGANELQVPLSPAQAERLLDYLDLLRRWNGVYNLTAVTEPRAMVVHHLLDSLAVLPALARQRLAPDETPLRLLDVGSGGGLPGVVLAVARGDVAVTCVDAVAKKALFIRQVAAELGLTHLRAEHQRLDGANAGALPAESFDIVCSRAFASLTLFTQLTRPLLRPGGAWLAMKGQIPADELAELPADLEAFHVEQLQVPGDPGERCIVWMRRR